MGIFTGQTSSHALQRVDAVVIDKFVLEYLKATDKSIISGADKLHFNAKPLEDKTLHLCVRDNGRASQILKDFNAGLAQVEVEAIVSAYFATAFK